MPFKPCFAASAPSASELRRKLPEICSWDLTGSLTALGPDLPWQCTNAYQCVGTAGLEKACVRRNLESWHCLILEGIPR